MHIILAGLEELWRSNYHHSHNISPSLPSIHLDTFLYSSEESHAMPILPLRSRSGICMLILMLRVCSAAQPQPFCSTAIYGIPNYRDCVSALRSMPFAQEPSTSINSRRFQLWSEPQYLQTPFAAVYNRYKPRPINQLPKIWRYSTSK